MKNETHPEIDNVTMEQATALLWLIVCTDGRDCKCHIVDPCIKCRTVEKAAAAFPNLYNTYLQAEQETTK